MKLTAGQVSDYKGAALLNSPLKKLVFPDRLAKRAIVPLPVSCAISK